MAVEEVRIFVRTILFVTLTIFYKEFAIEIPDAEADEIQTVQQGNTSCHIPFAASAHVISSAIDYIAKTPEGLSL